LDEVLPGNGWPVGAVTELINTRSGCGELSLLLPTLATLSRDDQRVIMVDPPWVPYPSTLHGHGLALEKLLLIHTHSRKESLWACEQVVRGIPRGALLSWPDSMSFGELRRLQIAAKSTQHSIFLLREQSAAAAPSPAALRLGLAPDDGDLQIRILKCRGQRPVSSIRIRRTQLFRPYMPLSECSGRFGVTQRVEQKRPQITQIKKHIPHRLHGLHGLHGLKE
jgi:cell division inhibitor SulA